MFKMNVLSNDIIALLDKKNEAAFDVAFTVYYPRLVAFAKEYVHEKGFHDAVELYDLKTDPSETNNVADRYPEIVEQIKSIMLREHETSEAFPFNFELEKN